jgi:hypothetical protein
MGIGVDTGLGCGAIMTLLKVVPRLLSGFVFTKKMSTSSRIRHKLGYMIDILCVLKKYLLG